MNRASLDLCAQTENWTSSQPYGHAPIGVTGDHRQGKDEWMVSYRYMRMSMQDNLDGREKLANSYYPKR